MISLHYWLHRIKIYQKQNVLYLIEFFKKNQNEFNNSRSKNYFLSTPPKWVTYYTDNYHFYRQRTKSLLQF